MWPTPATGSATAVPPTASSPRAWSAAVQPASGRGASGVDLDAVCALAVRLGELLLDGGHRLIELNPVVVWADGCVALDALIASG